MLIQVIDSETNVVYSNSMRISNKHTILEIHFCTSYTQVRVQDEIIENGNIRYPQHDLFLDPLDGSMDWADFIAITDNDHLGEWIRERGENG